MAIVIFNQEEFRGRYPQFTEDLVSYEQLLGAFESACLILDNSESSPVPYNPDKHINDRKTLLYMLVCHMVTLFLRASNGQAGPVASAAEGSVNVSFAVSPVTGRTEDWFIQTPCGQAYWNSIKKYMIGGRYAAACRYHPWG